MISGPLQTDRWGTNENTLVWENTDPNRDVMEHTFTFRPVFNNSAPFRCFFQRVRTLLCEAVCPNVGRGTLMSATLSDQVRQSRLNDQVKFITLNPAA